MELSRVGRKEEVEKVNDEGGLNEAVETVVRSGRRREGKARAGELVGLSKMKPQEHLRNTVLLPLATVKDGPSTVFIGGEESAGHCKPQAKGRV